MVDLQQALTESQLREHMNEAAKATDLRRGQNSIVFNKPISDTTYHALVEELEICLEVGQSTTTARSNARKDIRNFLSMIIMNHEYDLNMILMNNASSSYIYSPRCLWITFSVNIIKSTIYNARPIIMTYIMI
jgi:predicted RNase H-like HicB family nuclease